ncbi:MAG: type I DNA topoisomerase [Anaerovoracaceae bacterium]|jgi:DNA topoisomerase-1
MGSAGTTKKSKSAKRKQKLVIVESPSKAKTIKKYLGPSYKVIASVGHVRDLPKSKLGVDIENDFTPNYIPIRGKGDIIKEIKKDAKNASYVYLATDPDREGEAIAWHLEYLLGIDPEEECRITFNEITKDKVKESVKHPRKVDTSLVDAQQARRVLDRLVGYQISPLLWRKIRRGLSGGRVQSAALKIICDREQEIRDFVPKEYWEITADFVKDGQEFQAKLQTRSGKKLTVENREQNEAILRELKNGEYAVNKIIRKQTKKRPYAPYTTSTLQQDASSRLNFATRKTMSVAQQLYEGVDIKGQGTTGLITYLRTDSVRISDEARQAAKSFIMEQYGPEYYKNNFYKNKNKEIQDAHEAIRPANVTLIPEEIRESLTPDQYKLYSLIWQRFVASQMSETEFDSMSVDIQNGNYGFRASGSRMTFDGYRKVYKSRGEDKDRLLPELAEGERLDPKDVKGEQNFTKPPARYTEATLVHELEDKNIGRPSTYAPIVATLLERRYVRRDKKTLTPTDLGETVNTMLCTYFKDIVDAGFTADMESRLDDIEVKGSDWKQVIRDFYGPFSEELKKADEAIEKVTVQDKPTDEVCELCGRPMVIKMGRYGEFMACSGYPECKNTKPILKKIGVKCPKCGKDLVQRRSRRGKIFYGCSGYPDCDQVFWDEPIDRKCPECGSLLLKKRGKYPKIVCSNPECGYKEDVKQAPDTAEEKNAQ